MTTASPNHLRTDFLSANGPRLRFSTLPKFRFGWASFAIIQISDPDGFAATPKPSGSVNSPPFFRLAQLFTLPYRLFSCFLLREPHFHTLVIAVLPILVCPMIPQVSFGSHNRIVPFPGMPCFVESEDPSFLGLSWPGCPLDSPTKIPSVSCPSL